MKIVNLVLNAAMIALACLCVATTAAQFAIVAFLWSNGTLTSDKVLRYSAAVYGLDLTQLPATRTDGRNAEQPDELKTREEIIESRVQNSELLARRREAIGLGIADVREAFRGVRVEAGRFEDRKKSFDQSLQQQEVEARAAAIQEVQRTLASLRPKQAKTLIVRMLDDRDRDAEDNVMADIVTMLERMPGAKTKKIMGEFKTEDEEERLHEIFRAIGQLE